MPSPPDSERHALVEQMQRMHAQNEARMDSIEARQERQCFILRGDPDSRTDSGIKGDVAELKRGQEAMRETIEKGQQATEASIAFLRNLIFTAIGLIVVPVIVAIVAGVVHLPGHTP